jgi:carbohydrate kinase (thermoresistant glucokinase family)
MIVLLMGVSGSGKTRIGTQLAEELSWEFLDGDDFHGQEQVKKMASGIPLTEQDRELWLEVLRELLQDRREKSQDCILACSALTAEFRRKLLKDFPDVVLIHLHGDFKLITKRMKNRRGHYFRPKLLTSQFETLQSPVSVLRIDISKSPDEIVGEICEYLEM